MLTRYRVTMTFQMMMMMLSSQHKLLHVDDERSYGGNLLKIQKNSDTVVAILVSRLAGPFLLWYACGVWSRGEFDLRLDGGDTHCRHRETCFLPHASKHHV